MLNTNTHLGMHTHTHTYMYIVHLTLSGMITIVSFKIQCKWLMTQYKMHIFDIVYVVYISIKLPWSFPGVPLKFRGAPRNIQCNLDKHGYNITVIITLHTMISFNGLLYIVQKVVSQSPF